jgi:hypothetical protein
MVDNKATIQIPKSDNFAVLPIVFVLLDKILKPNENKKKNGIPTKIKVNTDINHMGKPELLYTMVF